MPVLVEAATLIAPSEALRRALALVPGGAAALKADGEADDGELLALRFPAGKAAWRAALRLDEAGLALTEGGEPGALAAVGQQMGPAGWWPWLELAVVPAVDATPAGGAGLVLAARRAGGQGRQVVTPAGWRLEGSASRRHPLAALRMVDRPLRHLRREPDRDLYLDRWTGEALGLLREHAPVRLVVEGPGPARGEVLAELVTRDDEIELGLMFREALPPGAGMLFLFDRPGYHHFWMKNTLLPLDLLFVAQDGLVVNVAAQARPGSLRYSLPARPVRAVLEVPGGWCAARGVGAGARLRPERDLPGGWPGPPA